ncbi:hypothetical protein H0H87_003931 [Tephrocybe sp. NHM501043]|nr:hypothetical protein H0H87_003931 [Tephrocybe sp. NHM501043]
MRLASTSTAIMHHTVNGSEVSSISAINKLSLTSTTKSMRRSPSPAPTEVDDPEPDLILEGLKNLNIKVCDFAYAPATAGTVKPATEIFDPYNGIAEYEYRLSQKPRTHPIQGKTMRRLFVLGWVSIEEAKDRLEQIDWDELKEFDNKNTGYPWRSMKFTSIPDTKERQKLLEYQFHNFLHVDKVRRQLQQQEDYLEQQRIIGMAAVERAQLAIQQQEQRAADERRLRELMEETRKFYASGYADMLDKVNGKKRALEHTPSTPNLAVSDSTTDGAKRVKLACAPSASASSAPFASSSQHSTAFTAPPQQYPAALQSYDPQLYPDAARIITAEARPPIILPDEPTPPVSEDEDADNRPGVRLQRRNRGLQRTLSRTQTFTQL